VSFEEQIMSKDKYPSIFSPKMEASVFIVLQIFFATRAVLKIREYSRIFPSFGWGIFGHVTCLDQSRASENIWWIMNINILTWLRGFQDKIANFVRSFCPSVPKRYLNRKKTPLNIDVCPESLGAMLQYFSQILGFFLFFCKILSKPLPPSYCVSRVYCCHLCFS